MSWKKMVLPALGAAALVAGFLTLSAFRHGPGGCGPGRDPGRMERFIGSRVDDLLEDVSATPEQRAKVLAVKDRLFAEGKALHGEQGAVHRELLSQWGSPNPDVGRVHALIDQRAEEMKAFAHRAADGLAEVHAVLTPEQRARVARKMKRHAEE